MKNKQHTLPSFFLISSAVDGNENAIEKLLLFYEAYISKCCLRPFYDEYGNVYIVVDMELKGGIRKADGGRTAAAKKRGDTHDNAQLKGTGI